MGNTGMLWHGFGCRGRGSGLPWPECRIYRLAGTVGSIGRLFCRICGAGPLLRHCSFSIILRLIASKRAPMSPTQYGGLPITFCGPVSNGSHQLVGIKSDDFLPVPFVCVFFFMSSIILSPGSTTIQPVPMPIIR